MHCYFMLTNNIWIFVQSSSPCQTVCSIGAGRGQGLQDREGEHEKLMIDFIYVYQMYLISH